MPHDPQNPSEGQPPRSELTSKALIFGAVGDQGYLPKALTLMSGQPTPAELLEAEQLLGLAVEEVKRWRNFIVRNRPCPAIQGVH